MSDSHEVSLPQSVKKQVEEADKIIAEMNQQQQNPEPQPEPEPQPAEMPTDVPPAHPKEAQQVKPQPEPEPKREDWKQKYSVLKGKYDAEVPRMADDIRELKQMLRESGEQVTTLHAQVAALKAEPKPEPKPAAPLVSAEEIEQFGPDLIDVVERVAKQAVSPYVDQKVGEVASTVKQVNESVASTQKSVAESARERLYVSLDEKVPGWDGINKDPKFVAWLREEDGLSGQPRGVSLRSAFDRNDTEKVVKIFKGFQKEHVVGDDPNLDAPADEVTPESQQGLDTLVAPGTPKTGSTDAQVESGKRIWTQADIRAFYLSKDEIVRSRPNDDLPSEMAAAERDIFAAQRENRIRA
jgi:hypothetical protein